MGDGSPITVQVASEPFTFNVELMVDPCSGAVTGASVRDNEDGEAVVEAFRDGVVTTGAAPLAVLLDNKPSNHTDAVVEALDPATVVPATLGRPQNKAHVEGAFGLFQQVAPVLALVALTPKALARQLLESVVTTWARTLNHRPRAARDGRSRVELHRESATPEQIASVGNQTGGRVFLFITTDDFHRDHARMTAQGVIFEGPARHETYGTVAVFRDLYGNRIDLIQPR